MAIHFPTHKQVGYPPSLLTFGDANICEILINGFGSRTVCNIFLFFSNLIFDLWLSVSEVLFSSTVKSVSFALSFFETIPREVKNWSSSCSSRICSNVLVLLLAIFNPTFHHPLSFRTKILPLDCTNSQTTCCCA